jgi:hypothetical protein
MLNDGDPAHPLLSATGFGCSLASAVWLLPLGHPLQRDPLMLLIVGTIGVAAGRMLLFAMGRRPLAAATSLLVLACITAIRVRVERGTWSGLPVSLLPLTALAMIGWIPGSSASPRWGARAPWVPRPPDQPSRPADLATASSLLADGFPMEVTDVFFGRWAVLGGRLLPNADPGGQSRIHLALDTWSRGRQVVAKLPRPEQARLSMMCLAHEAELLRLCRGSPHVVTLLDCGLDPGSDIFVVILARHGRGSLAHYLRTASAFPLGLAVAIVEDLLRGVIDLHEHCGQPIVHGDLNPRNLLRRDHSQAQTHPTVVICDLGMARRDAGNAAENQTAAIGLAYSPWYAAPELLNGPTDWGLEADIYGAAAVLYELVTGQAPLRRESAWLCRDFETLTHEGVLPASAGAVNPDLPGDLVDLLDHCLAVRPRERPGTAGDVLACLRRARRGFEDLSIPFAALRRWDGPIWLRSA